MTDRPAYRAGSPRKNPGDPKWVAKDQAEADRLGLTLEEYRASYLRGYDPQTGEPMPPRETKRKKSEATLDAVLQGDPAECPPKYNADGSVNRDFFKYRMARATDLLMDVIENRREMPRNVSVKDIKDVFKMEAEEYGLSADHLDDNRTPEEKMLDIVRQIVDAPRSVFEIPEQELGLLEAQMDRADHFAEAMVGVPGTQRGAAIEANRPGIAERAARLRKNEVKKKLTDWADLLRRVAWLRRRASCEIPDERAILDDSQRLALRCVQLLRWTIYVMRPSDKGRPIFEVGRHHVQFVAGMWGDKHGWNMTEGGGTEWDKGPVEDVPQEGVIWVVPPGHGKTTTTIGCISCWLKDNPALRVLIIHAQADTAKENLGLLASAFRRDNPFGRRVLSFNPSIQVVSDSAGRLRLSTGEPQKAPTLAAAGMRAKKSGIDADLIWFDDPVDQASAESEAERKRDFSRINGTWLPRLRGKRPFHVTTTTLWHPDDANAKRIRLIREDSKRRREHRRFRVRAYIQPCGGPEPDASGKRFKPIWPEFRDADDLRRIYEEIRDPMLYAAAWQCDPSTSALQKVRRLSLYCSDIPDDGFSRSMLGDIPHRAIEQHRRFLASATFYISIDPSATAREDSDKASFVYAALGDLVHEIDGAEKYERMLRVLDARQFLATQPVLVEEVREFAAHNKVDYIICETKSGFHATADMFEVYHGIDVIRIVPSNRNKIQRLQDVAPVLDDKLRDKGLSPPKVQFPGVYIDARQGHHEELGEFGMEIAPDLRWLHDQILKAGMWTEDHGLDATTQLVKHLGSDLGLGQGMVSMQAQLSEQKLSESAERLKNHLDRIEAASRRPGGSAAEQDYRFSQEMGRI